MACRKPLAAIQMYSMRVFIFLVSIIFVPIEVDAQHLPTEGHYQNDSTTHGKLTNSLDLNCNYTFEFSLKSRCFDEKYFGSWISNYDTLKLIIDSSSAGAKLYKDSILFIIDGLRFYEFPWPKAMLHKVKTYFKNCKDESGNKIRIKKRDTYSVRLHKMYSIKAPKGKGYRYMNILNVFRCRL
jgi:hypothetical protein